MLYIIGRPLVPGYVNKRTNYKWWFVVVVVAQLVEWSLAKPKVRSSNSVIGKLLCRTFVYCQLYWKDKHKEKEARKGPLFKKWFSTPGWSRRRSVRSRSVWASSGLHILVRINRSVFSLRLRVSTLVLQRLADDVTVVRDADGTVTVGVAAVVHQEPIPDPVRQGSIL